MNGRTVALLAALSLASCTQRREIEPTLGVAIAPRWEYSREAPPWPSANGANDAELEAARRAVDAGMIDPLRLEPYLCGRKLGWRSGATVFLLEGGARPQQECFAESPGAIAAYREEIERRGTPVTDLVSRALLLRLGVSRAALAAGAPAHLDRDAVVRAWGARMWSDALRWYTGRDLQRRDDGLARQLLHAARYAVGFVERSGAAPPSVRGAFPFAALARELDDQRWLVPRSGDAPSDAPADVRSFPSISINGWRNASGEGWVELMGPLRCPEEIRRNPALRYRPSVEWFDSASRAEVLTQWRALEGLLQRLNSGRSLSRTLLASCDDRQPDRVARGYEVAYMLLAAAVGYDALAPDEVARFERGDARLLSELETRFRERIRQAGASREDLARRHLDQDATRVLWPSSSRALAEFHRSRAADASGPASMQRSRDAARVIAAARSSATVTADRCALLIDAIDIDVSTARESAVAIARTIWADVERGENAGAAGCAGLLIAKLHHAGLVRASEELPRLLASVGRQPFLYDPAVLLAALREDPNATGAWVPAIESAEGLCHREYDCIRWLSKPAVELYARSPVLRSWALGLLESRAPLRGFYARWGSEPQQCRSTSSSEARTVFACLFWSQLPDDEVRRPSSIEGAISLVRSILESPAN
ncbi:MAG: hypothetical protein U0269_02510 [Polyangiales bacterium]